MPIVHPAMNIVSMKRFLGKAMPRKDTDTNVTIHRKALY